jgi:hypothetical protein
MTIHTLTNPRATSSGDVHRVHYVITEDRAIVVLEDTMMDRATPATLEAARADYRERLRRGHRPTETSPQARRRLSRDLT